MERQQVIVTGSASGIGRAIAETLLLQGWQVSGWDQSPATLEHPHYRHECIDLMNVQAIAERVRGLSFINGIVHAAGFMTTSALGELQSEDSARLWQIHVLAAEVLVNASMSLLQPGARIVLIGSRTSKGASRKSQYAAVKAALIGLSRSWAIELVQQRITVNVISPAATLTPLLTDSRRGAVPPKLPPMGHYIDPRDIAAMVAHLLGPSGQSITGQEIIICAGSSL